MKGLNLQEKYLLLKFKINPADAEVYAQLYDIYVDKIYRFVLFKVSNVEEAQDITAEVFLKVWQYIQSHKKVGNFKALLYQSARNKVIDYYRQKAKKEMVHDEDLMQNIIDQRGENLVKEIEVKWEIKSLDHFLRQLKAEYHEVLILKYIEGYSNAEIGNILDKTTSNVRVLSHRALKVLQTLIIEANNKPEKYDRKRLSN